MIVGLDVLPPNPFATGSSPFFISLLGYVFYFFATVFLVGIFDLLLRHWSGLGSIARAVLQILIVIGGLALPIYAFHGIVIPMKDILLLIGLPSAAALVLPAAAPRGALAAEPGRPAGFNLLKDTNKGYAFLYPFGWQEVSVDGEEVVYKDVIEPLESVSLSVTPAPEGKESIADFGNLDEVSETFISKVLTAPGQPYKTTATKQREQAGTTFYTMEYEVQAQNYSRAAFTTVAIKNNKLYTLTTGANMRRYKKMEDRLRTVVNSFQFIF